MLDLMDLDEFSGSDDLSDDWFAGDLETWQVFWVCTPAFLGGVLHSPPL
jgi:hypothetical protein